MSGTATQLVLKNCMNFSIDIIFTGFNNLCRIASDDTYGINTGTQKTKEYLKTTTTEIEIYVLRMQKTE